MESKKHDNDQHYWNFIFSLIFVFLVLLSIVILNLAGKFPHKISSFDFFLLSVATFRLIRLFVYDSVTNYIRDYFAKFPKGPKKTISNLLGCPWCTGVWMAFFVAFFYFTTSLAWYPILILALAGVGSFIQIVIYKIGYGL